MPETPNRGRGLVLSILCLALGLAAGYLLPHSAPKPEPRSMQPLIDWIAAARPLAGKVVTWTQRSRSPAAPFDKAEFPSPYTMDWGWDLVLDLTADPQADLYKIVRGYGQYINEGFQRSGIYLGMFGGDADLPATLWKQSDGTLHTTQNLIIPTKFEVFQGNNYGRGAGDSILVIGCLYDVDANRQVHPVTEQSQGEDAVPMQRVLQLRVRVRASGFTESGVIPGNLDFCLPTEFSGAKLEQEVTPQ